jgi:hypothetical protein
MENIVVNTTNDSSAMNSNSNFSQSPRIAKTGAVLFRQSLSPTPFQWKKGEKIGHGTYGDVFMALNQVTGELFCVKQIRVQPGVVGGEKEAFILLNNLKLIKLAVSLGSTESLVQHPATMTHIGVDEEMKEVLGINEKLVRLSVGVENHEDLIADIAHSLSLI